MRNLWTLNCPKQPTSAQISAHRRTLWKWLCAQVINKLEILSCPIAKSGSTSLKETIRIIQSKIKDKSLPAKRHDQNHTFDTVGHKFKDLGIQNQIEQSNYHFLFSFEQKKRMKLFFDFCPKNIKSVKSKNIGTYYVTYPLINIIKSFHF